VQSFEILLAELCTIPVHLYSIGFMSFTAGL
jgi:hypothetical protein